MNFVIVGKAKTVFRVLELRAQREQELQDMMNPILQERKKLFPCRLNPDGPARCNVPQAVCEQSGCFEIVNRRYTDVRD